MLELRRRMVRLLTVVLFPLLVLLVLLAPTLIPWLFGPEWAPAVVPTQILAAGGAATLVIDTVGSALQAAGRAREMLGYGVAHFVVYAAAVWVVAPLGLTQVSIVAAVVHTIFLVVAYQLLLRGRHEPVLRFLWHDVSAACVSCAGLIVVAGPVNWAMTASGVPTLVHLAAVAIAGGLGYLIVLRLLFGAAWRDLLAAVRRVVPARLLPRRARGGQFVTSAQPQASPPAR
jgi:lipopolysaccharide exporter